MATTLSSAHYVGRFAPSPSGPLHLGSLLCALASYLDAKASKGRWLVRIEDIDPPREILGASDAILETLHQHGLHWDAPLVYQSSRSEQYRNTLNTFVNNAQAYPCGCNRKRLAELDHRYDSYCLQHPPAANTPTALRFNTATLTQDNATTCFEDMIQGRQCEDFRQNGDFVIHRKDGLFAYQLAVVVDDIAQGITHIVRGSDLLDTTAKQILLMQSLGYTIPQYAHIPVLNSQNGLKPSKQNHAQAVENHKASHNLLQCLRYLNQQTPASLQSAKVETILQWAIEHWSMSHIPRCMSIAL